MFLPLVFKRGSLHLIVFIEAVTDDLTTNSRQLLESTDQKDVSTFGLSVTRSTIICKSFSVHIVPLDLLFGIVVLEEGLLEVMAYKNDRFLCTW